MKYLATTNTMRNIFILGFLSVLLIGCSAAQRHLKNGNYQAAIEVGARKMRQNPKKADKTILAIERAFKIEKSRITDKINQLKREGNPENWLSIYNLYKQLNQYQSVLKPVLPMFIQKEFRNADIELINIDQELADTKIKAAEFLYVEADNLLKSTNKIDAREAYGRFQKVKELHSNFRDVNAKIQEAYNKGQNHILIHYTNDTRMIIPQEFMANLQRYNADDLNSEWTKYHLKANEFSIYDFGIEVHIQTVDIGPEQIRETNYEDVAKVQDGFQYILDGKGNVAKDTLGNDLKEPKYVDVKALITKTEQTKIGVLTGVIVYKKANKQSFKTFPFREDLVFQNFFGTAQGDQRAVSEQSAQLIGGRPLPFPTDIQMVMDASEIIKGNTFEIIKGNQGLVYE
jgi:hypothetical protein